MNDGEQVIVVRFDGPILYLFFFLCLNIVNMSPPIPAEFAGYTWKIKKVVKPGETEAVIQMHLEPPPDELRQQLDDQSRMMGEYARLGHIPLPPDLALIVGFNKWNPRDQAQTSRVLQEMARPA
jgi:hypothetical protein